MASAKSASRRPLIVKLSPNVTSIPQMAHAAADAGADAISLVNTFVGMAIDIETRRPRISNITGGLSGPAIKPLALRMVYQIHRAGLGMPICGIGGIQSGLDAIEFLLAGATTVQVGTQNFIDPASSERVIRELEEFCRANAITDLRELVGGLVV